jgi:hypothetical protein
MSVGTIGSTEKGSGARFNDGKAHVEYIPMRIIADFYRWVYLPDPEDIEGFVTASDYTTEAVAICDHIARFEEGGDKRSLHAALNLLKEYKWAGSGDQFHFGATKYEAWNWARGMAWSVVLACLKRHLIAILDGEEIDRESGVHHFGAVGCNLIMLLHFIDHYPEGDDRPPQYIFSEPQTGPVKFDVNTFKVDGQIFLNADNSAGGSSAQE